MASNLGGIKVKFDLLDDIVLGEAMFFDKIFNCFERLLRKSVAPSVETLNRLNVSSVMVKSWIIQTYQSVPWAVI
jgi:hypothetical protein